MRINDPKTAAEIETTSARHEGALVGNDVDTLNNPFRNEPPTIRTA